MHKRLNTHRLDFLMSAVALRLRKLAQTSAMRAVWRFCGRQNVRTITQRSLLEGRYVAIQVSSQPVQLQRNCVDLLGISVDRIALESVVEWMEACIASGEPHQIITANLDFIAIKRKRPSFGHVIQNADLVVCDGKPLQWAAQLRGDSIPARVTGMDLVLHAARLSATKGYRIFLLGAAPGVAPRAAREIQKMLPGTDIVGTYTPPDGEFSDADNAQILEIIHTARPDVLFVALGAPRQDEWIAEHLQELDVPVCAGIGGVFNMLAGVTRRAPTWMQNAGMEWAYRLAQEPGRLWRRYLVHDVPIFAQLLTEQLMRRANALVNGQAAVDAADLVTLAAPMSVEADE